MSEAKPSRPDSEAKTIALVLSTMRSGSTLLKALLSTPADVSKLPETDFQKFQSADAPQRIAALAPHPIILLKRPAWFNEGRRYPKLPNARTKRIILARDAHTNLLSLRKMAYRKLEPILPNFLDDWMAVHYWARVYDSLLNRFPADDPDNYWIRYEDLLQEPRRYTQELFAFIGSEQKEGIESYSKPKGYEWKWGTDDGGHKIKSLAVQASPIPQRALDILERVGKIESVADVRRRLRYV